jgi:hypothetical protein
VVILCVICKENAYWSSLLNTILCLNRVQRERFVAQMKDKELDDEAQEHDEAFCVVRITSYLTTSSPT